MRRLPPIDLHAHVEADIAAPDLTELGALVFAATRSLDEAERALSRSDPWTIWGVGCHPGLVGAQKAFDPGRFAQLITKTAYVGEIGLDGSSRVARHTQRRTFEAILATLRTTPRITTIHSHAATATVLDCLTTQPIHGAVLHWWLGDENQTKKAIELGCSFSVNASMLKHPELLGPLPLDRLLPETDHPFGNRSAGRSRRPGNVADVERTIGRIHGLDETAVRLAMWRNLAAKVAAAKCGSLLPRPTRIILASIT